MNDELVEKIQHLRDYVQSTDTIDDEKRESIVRSLDEIEQAAPQHDLADAIRHPIQTLKHAAEELEASHPDGFAAFQKICDTLGRMGI